MKENHHLTPRESQVLGLLMRGLTDKEIAAELGISRRTASHCVSLVLLKLDVRTRTEAVAMAFQAGLRSAVAGTADATADQS
jgi:DNA-binding NarL/FixJ family response regulator